MIEINNKYNLNNLTVILMGLIFSSNNAQIYQHYKGQQYELLYIGTHTETLERLVVYKSLSDNKIWIRPKNMFHEYIDKELLTKRFVKVT